jgi:hypothetical protein
LDHPCVGFEGYLSIGVHVPQDETIVLCGKDEKEQQQVARCNCEESQTEDIVSD